MASSFSQGDAFISSKPKRTTTFTSSPPSRREERQQSIAGVAAAKYDDALADAADVAETKRSRASRCRYGCLRRFLAAGDVEDRARAAHRSRRKSRRNFPTAAPSCCRRACRRRTRRRDRECSGVFPCSSTFSGRRNFGIGWHHAAGQRILVEHDAFVAHRDRSRATVSEAGPPPTRRNALAVLCAAGLGRRSRMSSLKSAATRFSRQIATGYFSTSAAAARGLTGAIAGAAEHAGEYIRIPN